MFDEIVEQFVLLIRMEFQFVDDDDDGDDGEEEEDDLFENESKTMLEE